MLVGAKGFSLVEILVVMAIVGIITTTGFMVFQNSLRDARLQNEFTHLKQLIKKYSKQSLTSQMPIQINFFHNSPNTTASIYSMSEIDDEGLNNYSRFNTTDCDDIHPEDPAAHAVIIENDDTFNNVLIKACDGSSDLNFSMDPMLMGNGVCFSGRGDFVDDVDNGSTPTVYILPYKQDRSCGFLASVTIPNKRQLTLFTSGYFDGVSTAPNFNSFNVVSSSFSDGGMMQDSFGCNGSNMQFNLSWNGFPAGITRYFAIIMDDPDVIPDTFVHWSVFNISEFDTEIAEGGVIGGVVGKNDYDRNDYLGPCPPLGETHFYVTSVYALSGALDLDIADDPVTRVEFESQFTDLILARGTITSQYEG